MIVRHPDGPIIGFTGARRGMRFDQKQVVWKLLSKLCPDKVHHGDCVGSDANFHQVARQMFFYVVRHPPIDLEQRAFCDFDEDRSAEEYLHRNRNIVDETDLLIAVSRSTEEILRSGTWSTIRYAHSQHKPIYIVLPNGDIKEEVPA